MSMGNQVKVAVSSRFYKFGALDDFVASGLKFRVWREVCGGMDLAGTGWWVEAEEELREAHEPGL